MVEIIFLTLLFIIFWTFTSNKFKKLYGKENIAIYNSLLHSIIIYILTFINLLKNEINCYNIIYFRSYLTDINLSVFLSYLIVDLMYLKKKDIVNIEFDILGKYIKNFLK